MLFVELSKKIGVAHKQTTNLYKATCYCLENEAYCSLPKLLRRDWQIEVTEPLRRDWLLTVTGKMVEVNIVGQGRRYRELYATLCSL